MCILLQSSPEQEKSSTAASQVTEKDSIESPSDIYSKFSSSFGPRSILKGKTEHKKQRQKKKSERKVAFETDGSDRQSASETYTKQVRFVYEPPHEKTCIWGLRPCETKTNLPSHRS